MIAQLHAFFTRIGVSPKLGDQLLGAIALIFFNWLVTGEPLDVDGIKLAAGLFILGVLGVAAPPATGITQDELAYPGRRRRLRGEAGLTTVELLLIVLVVVVLILLLAPAR